MEYKLKTIAKSGIDEALSKAQLYRYLNEPEESESICQDILAADPENQAALTAAGTRDHRPVPRLGFGPLCRSRSHIQGLSDPYKREYYLGILCERRAKAQVRAGRPSQRLGAAVRGSNEAFRVGGDNQARDNEEAVLRWNRCARLLQTIPSATQEETISLGDDDTAPLEFARRSVKVQR